MSSTVRGRSRFISTKRANLNYHEVFDTILMNEVKIIFSALTKELREGIGKQNPENFLTKCSFQ
jgi:hypothetical protein